MTAMNGVAPNAKWTNTLQADCVFHLHDDWNSVPICSFFGKECVPVHVRFLCVKKINSELLVQENLVRFFFLHLSL